MALFKRWILRACGANDVSGRPTVARSERTRPQIFAKIRRPRPEYNVIMTKNEKELRQHVVNLLTWGDAHQDFEGATKNMPFNLQGKRPKGSPHSPWELLEHLRITLWDILEFSRDAKHKSPEFPKGLWPESPEPPNEKAWDASVKSYPARLTEHVRSGGG